jgi:Tfp pilus assembly protein PilF
MDKARAALAKNHTQDAQKAIDAALKVTPDYADALTLRAVLEVNA